MMFDAFIRVFLERRAELGELFLDHLGMTVTAVVVSLLIGIPLGIRMQRSRALAGVLLGAANVLQSIPSIALLAFFVPVVGIGAPSAVLMVIVYALLPILKGTYTGLQGVDPKLLEVARGMGMNEWQRLRRVSLPLAFPYVMSGVRVSAVSSVGTMTIAAFAGAGGLGWFVNVGLNSQSTELVLLGAIPASLTAIGLDFLLGRMEALARPAKHAERPRRRREALLLAAVAAALLAVPVVQGVRSAAAASEPRIVVGSFNFTESTIVGHLAAQLIEARTGLAVERRFNLGGLRLGTAALESGDVDILPVYTGTALANILKEKVDTTDPDTVYRRVVDGMRRSYGAAVTKPLGFNNTYVMAVEKEKARGLGLATVRDLVRAAPRLRLGATVDFIEREDGLPKMKSFYGSADFAEVRGLDSALRYEALASGEVDVVDGFATDALLTKTPSVLLKDADRIFPPYDAIYVVRGEIESQRPEVLDALELLSGAVSDDDMRRMNRAVDIEGKNAADVAREFLHARGLV